MLPPYAAGAARSRLITHASAHPGVQLSPEELAKRACWIDLLAGVTRVRLRYRLLITPAVEAATLTRLGESTAAERGRRGCLPYRSKTCLVSTTMS
ncbi:MAG: hypothetical protein AB1716_24900 [Planctomycetota bacterium]